LKNSRLVTLSAGLLLTLITAEPAVAVCRVQYFSNVKATVGSAGLQRRTLEEPSLASSRLGPFSVGTAWLEVARFFSAPLSSTLSVRLTPIGDGKPLVTLYADKSGTAQMQARVRLHDFDPATGTAKVIADALTTPLAGNQSNAHHSVMSMPVAAGTRIEPGHRLMWTVSYASAANPPNYLLFRFGGNTSPSFGRVCWTER
jgi:hypothetical protein